MIVGSIKVKKNVESKKEIDDDVEFIRQYDIEANLEWNGNNFIENQSHAEQIPKNLEISITLYEKLVIMFGNNKWLLIMSSRLLPLGHL